MKINWMALLTVFGATLLTTLAVVVLFVIGIRALSADRKPVAYASFGGCSAVVLFGLYLIVA
ncbi:hypothetical protein Lesp02_29290 [Lentzea sp. NBRC 105346]|uniref:hypothetical protein n=1 Tax=Lentzea sp. NBRC 105346 TaxID=3032205 RepID=UPI0024A31A8C|nr:hypothetical protein [Lentzea sp. NBRC 105346]GLZ30740.1 hypothetical protein Lesp02_29290 [Lentzea sp. NBRC 105346]